MWISNMESDEYSSDEDTKSQKKKQNGPKYKKKIQWRDNEIEILRKENANIIKKLVLLLNLQD